MMQFMAQPPRTQVYPPQKTPSITSHPTAAPQMGECPHRHSRQLHIAAPCATAWYSASMTLHEDLKKAIPDAMRARDEVRLRTLRSLVTAMTNEVVAKRRRPDEFLTDEEAIAILKRAANQRKDSIEQFEKANRTDLADPEKAELSIIESYLPAQMSREAIMVAAKAKIAELGAIQKADAGKFIGTLMKDLSGKADGADVKAVVESLLT